MSEHTKLFEHAGARYEPPNLSTDDLLFRRDRKHWNRRITAAVVGIAVFVAAVWVVRDVASLNGGRSPVVPGGGTTGPRVVEPSIGPTGDPFSVGFDGLPPEGVSPSEPTHGELVLTDGGIHPWYEVFVFADGRLIWARGLMTDPGPTVSVWIEQRLTPEGVELLRSGAVELGGQYENPGQSLPVGAWEDPTLRPYVPSRYMLCPWDPPLNLVSVLPRPAQELIRGIEPTDARTDVGDWTPGCLEVTVEDARTLAGILTDAGFEESRRPEATGMVFFGDAKRGYLIAFDPILPHGEFVDGVGG
jgi:hypothetical protein